jgi:hypothetical protein
MSSKEENRRELCSGRLSFFPFDVAENSFCFGGSFNAREGEKDTDPFLLSESLFYTKTTAAAAAVERFPHFISDIRSHSPA